MCEVIPLLCLCKNFAKGWLRIIDYIHIRVLQSNHQLTMLHFLPGGGSAQVVLPRPPLTLEDKIAVTKLMKSHGVPTLEMNIVRKNLSLIKGGGLSEMAAPAKVR